jgi:thiamine-phosphate pyrophosphorylase
MYRLLDAAANRAGEALRVVEDYARFVLDDVYLTAQWKSLRHDLTTALESIPMSLRCAVRNTQHDVGTDLSLPEERGRKDLWDLAGANLSRLQQALRSLEETTKLIEENLAVRIESLRYQSYTLAAAMQITQDSRRCLESVRLCVLVDGCQSSDDFCHRVRVLVEAGVDAIQLRDKLKNDRDLLDRARLLSELTTGHPTLFLMNDRPDLAILSHADGVHLGQTDLAVKEVRQLVGANCLVGVSTHNIEQARQAVLDGANYLGVGPVFPSRTKSFQQFPGLPFLQQVACEVRLPAFAIGGINLENAGSVLESGIDRLAVAAAVTEAADMAAAVRDLRRILEGSLTSG